MSCNPIPALVLTPEQSSSKGAGKSGVSPTITEQEFRLGRSCPTKVLHLRSNLPRSDQDDSFSRWMRTEHGKFRAVAQVLFPQARVIDDISSAQRFPATKCSVAAGECAAGAFLVSEQGCCRVDVVEPREKTLRLYTFAAKPVCLERHEFGVEFYSGANRLRAEWRDILELAAFRVSIAQSVFPEHQIIPLLVVPVTGIQTRFEGLHDAIGWQPSPPAAASAAELLRVVSVVQEVKLVASSVRRRVEALQAFLAAPPSPDISYRCKKCEYRGTKFTSGFEICWGSLARVEPSMFELAYMYFIQDSDGQPVANRLAREGRVSLWDIPRAQIHGEYALRQRMQLEGTETGSEIILPELADALSGIVFPLHCLDIETMRSWLPAHSGNGVNDLVLFQYSIHTRKAADSEWTHRDWLNTEKSAPNRRFLAELRVALGDSGTVCVWTKYEQVSFAELLTDLIRTGEDGDDFNWLRRFLRSGRILDLHDICFRHHFHPNMRGRTSIKAVLPALWSVDSPVKRRSPYSEFPTDCDPYAVLKKAGAVSDGCMAMEGYLDVISADAVRSQAAQAALLRYCWVDTLAMCFVLDYWNWRLSAAGRSCGEEAFLD